MKIYIATELKSAYRLNDDSLEYAPINSDGTINTDSFNDVDLELIGDEEITFLGKKCTFNDAYAAITEILKS
ncbi:hypothetical protein BH23THE1_BH23THE1_36110 [soil metagenome]